MPNKSEYNQRFVINSNPNKKYTPKIEEKAAVMRKKALDEYEKRQIERQLAKLDDF